MDDLERFQRDVGSLLAGLADKGKLRTINRRIGVYLKNSSRTRIKQQQDVEGSAFAPRKPIKARTAYQRHANRGKLLGNIARATHLKSKYTADRLQIGYRGRAAKLARWHNEGSVQRMKKAGYSIVVPRRHYMGISEPDWEMINQIVIEEL